MGVAGDDYRTFMDSLENSKTSRKEQSIAPKPTIMSAHDDIDEYADDHSSQYEVVDGTPYEGSNFEYEYGSSYEEYAADMPEKTDIDENAYDSSSQYDAVDGNMNEDSSYYVDGTAVDGSNFEYEYDSSSSDVDGTAGRDNTFEYEYVDISDQSEGGENIVLANSFNVNQFHANRGPSAESCEASNDNNHCVCSEAEKTGRLGQLGFLTMTCKFNISTKAPIMVQDSCPTKVYAFY